jgi:ADP-ribose pyrophosphatase
MTRDADLDPADDPLAERVVASEVVHRGKYMVFHVDTIERPDGSRGRRDLVAHPGAVAILALDGHGRLLMVRQWRVAAGRALLEIPAGTLDVNDGATEDPLAAARRELEEETGHRAGTWRRLASFWTAPGFASELMHLYLATDLAPVGDDSRLTPDDDEELELRTVPLDEAVSMVEAGAIADAKSILGVLWLERLQASGAPEVRQS